MFWLRDSLFHQTSQSPRNNKHCILATIYKDEMFHRNNLDTIQYPISPNDVHLYEDEINITLLSFFDDKGRARHPLVISRNNYERVANLLYLKNYYAPIANISRLFSDLTISKRKQQICLHCLGHFRTEESYARDKQLCTREEFMSVLYVLPVPG